MPEPLTILCITSYEKGQEFMRECKRMGCRVLLMTLEKRKDANWPRESLDDAFYVPDSLSQEQIIHAVAYVSRTKRIDRIVALDEYDKENAAALREHMRIPGMGATTLRYFRDKLAMRGGAQDAGIAVPAFCPVLNYDVLREYMERVSPPWVLKPRSEASAIGIQKIHRADELWPLLDRLGDRQSYYLLEQFVPGEVYHVDSLVSENKLVLAEAHKYSKPPMQVSHQGGIFSTRTLKRTSPEARKLVALQRKLIAALGFVRGVNHTEFIHAHDDSQFYFLETAARVGGAYISDMVEAASGVNLWREWARIEVLGPEYKVPKAEKNYGGVILTLSRQEKPDTSAYNDPEIVARPEKRHHAIFILKSPDPERIRTLSDSYAERFVQDFYASQPPPEGKPTD